MNLWLVSREYAGIAEAGGVKNVATSLCESFVRLGHRVTLFIPLYGCSDLSEVEWDHDYDDSFESIEILGKTESITYRRGKLNGVDIVFVCHPSFEEKRAVYTYTQEDQDENPCHVKGNGHVDVNFMNVIFQKAVILYAKKCTVVDIPAVIHCQDAPTAMVPVYGKVLCNSDEKVREILEKTKYVVTIHNAGPGYHHSIGSLGEAVEYTGIKEDILRFGLAKEGVEPFVLAGLYSVVTTVSPEYANEIIENRTDTDGLAEKFNENHISITGITNGIDFTRYDTDDITKSQLPFPYDPLSGNMEGKYKCRELFIKDYALKESCCIPEGLLKYGYLDVSEGIESYVYIAYHGRVVHQKGIEVMCDATEKLLERNHKVKFIFAGQGAPELEDRLAAVATKYKGSVLYLKGYDKILARLSVAASDFSLHPSWFEPCGLEDFIAQTFGTLPIANATGGLNKIIDGKTGWLYSPNTADVLSGVMEKVSKMVLENGRDEIIQMACEASRYIHETYSWDKVALEYERLYGEN